MAGSKAGKAAVAANNGAVDETAENRNEADDRARIGTEEEVVSALVIPKSSGAVANLADVQSLMVEDAEQDHGFEKGDVAIPFFRILQSNSPQVKRQNGKFIEGAEAGMFLNTATNRIFSGMDGIYVVPVHFERQATLWQPRGEGGNAAGGFVSPLAIEAATELLKHTVKSPKNKDLVPVTMWDALKVLPGINLTQLNSLPRPMELELSIAAMYYILVIDKEDPTFVEPVAFGLTSTQMKKARTWNALIKNARLPNPAGKGSFNPAMFGFVYKLTTVPESNVHGDWMGVRITQDVPLIKYANGAPTESFDGAASIYLQARDFKALVASGKVTVKPDNDDDGGSMAGGEDDDEKTPF